MENNLSKAISQIKFPVRWREDMADMIDANNNVLFDAGLDYWHGTHGREEPLHAFGHALAEMINGLDGRGNLQEALTRKLQELKEQAKEGFDNFRDLNNNDSNQSAVLRVMKLFADEVEAPDRQVCDLCDNTGWEKENGDRCICVRKWDEGYEGRVKDRQVKSAEDFFQSKNGGKDSDTSVEHGETFTAKFVIDFAESYAQQYK